MLARPVKSVLVFLGTIQQTLPDIRNHLLREARKTAISCRKKKKAKPIVKILHSNKADANMGR